MNIKQILDRQKEEFDAKFDLATIIEDGINPAYISYRGAELSSLDNLLFEIEDFHTTSLKEILQALIDDVSNLPYSQNDLVCTSCDSRDFICKHHTISRLKELLEGIK